MQFYGCQWLRQSLKQISVFSSQIQTQISGVLTSQISHWNSYLITKASTQSLAVNLVQHTRLVRSQRYPNHTHTPQTQHLYNPLPVCALTYKGSLSRLLHTSLWCMACCSPSPLHLRMELVPSGPKQPGKFHCVSAKVRAVHSGSTAITVSLITV